MSFLVSHASNSPFNIILPFIPSISTLTRGILARQIPMNRLAYRYTFVHLHGSSSTSPLHTTHRPSLTVMFLESGDIENVFREIDGRWSSTLPSWPIPTRP